MRSQAAIERRIEGIRGEQPLTHDQAVITPMRLLVEAFLPQLRAVCAALERFDAEIAKLCPELPDYKLFRELPGAGPALAPRLLVAFGEQRERFPNAAALQSGSRAGHGTQREQVLGALALCLSELPAPNFRRVGGADRDPELLGEGLLRRLPSSRHAPSGGPSRARLQVDSHPVPLLGGPDSVR